MSDVVDHRCALFAGTVMVKGAQAALSPALQAMPSKARICSVSPTLPVTKLVCGN